MISVISVLPYNLTIHKQVFHEGVVYECDQFDITFAQQTKLYTPKKLKHEGVIYNCYKCDAGFSCQEDIPRYKHKYDGIDL